MTKVDLGRYHPCIPSLVSRVDQPSRREGGAPLTDMGGRIAVVLCVAAMAAVIVGVDFAFFRNQFWERMMVNIGLVLVFAAFYLRFLKHP
jgi:hypothetical protein